jgi:hypothetical protein
MIRFTFEFSDHAKQRCIQRNINTSRLRRQLLSIPYDEKKNNLIRWNIPETNLFVVFRDINFKRIIITVSFRQIKKEI